MCLQWEDGWSVIDILIPPVLRLTKHSCVPGGLGCVEFTGLGVPLASDCTIIHNTLLVIEGTFGMLLCNTQTSFITLTLPKGATFFLDPNTHLTLTSGTCEYQFSNNSPGQIEACWQDSVRRLLPEGYIIYSSTHSHGTMSPVGNGWCYNHDI